MQKEISQSENQKLQEAKNNGVQTQPMLDGRAWRETSFLLAALLFLTSSVLSFFFFETKLQNLTGFPFSFYGKGIFPWLGNFETRAVFFLDKLLYDVLFWILFALGAIWIAQHFFPSLLLKRKNRIIFITSIVGGIALGLTALFLIISHLDVDSVQSSQEDSVTFYGTVIFPKIGDDKGYAIITVKKDDGDDVNVLIPRERGKCPANTPQSLMEASKATAFPGMRVQVRGTLWSDHMTVIVCNAPDDMVIWLTESSLPEIDQPDTATSAAAWQIYRNEELGFAMQYPPYTVVDASFNDAYNQVIAFKKSGDETAFEIRIRKSIQPFDQYFYLDKPLAATTTIAGKEARVFEAPNGYCDGPGCSAPYRAYAMRGKEGAPDVYNIVFFGDGKLSVDEQKILNSFSLTH